MVAVRQKDPATLVNRKGGRGRGVAIAMRPPGWRMPSLPPTVTDPLKDPVQATFRPLAMRHVRLVWREWWRSTASLGVDLGSDLEPLNWWILCVFRRALYVQIVREQPLVRGSMGQPVRNPLEGTIAKLSEDVARAEQRFGMTTLDRFRLHFEARFSEEEDEGEREMLNEYRRLSAG